MLGGGGDLRVGVATTGLQWAVDQAHTVVVDKQQQQWQ